MKKQLFITVWFMLCAGTANSGERMADVASFVLSVWYAEEFNEHCGDNPIDVPISESELRELLILADGRNLLDVIAIDPELPKLNQRNGMKDMAIRATKDGCNSEAALLLRERTEKTLTIPSLLVELRETDEASSSSSE